MQKRPQQAFMIKTSEQIGFHVLKAPTNTPGKAASADRRMKPVSNLLPHTKINSKGIKDQNVKPQSSTETKLKIGSNHKYRCRKGLSE